MFDSFTGKGHSQGGSYGYPPPQQAPYGYPPPGPGYHNGPPPPNPYMHNNYGPPPQHYQQYAPPPGNYNYNGHPAPPPRSNGPSPVPGYGPPAPGRGPSPNPVHNMNAHHQRQPSNNRPQSLLLRQSPQTHKIILVHPSGMPVDAPPFYSVTSSPKAAKADYAMARGADPNDPNALIGTVKSHTFSSKYDLVVRGTFCTLKESSLGDKYTIEIPGMGVYKWHTESMSSKMWLKDENKNVLVSYDKVRNGQSSVSGWKKFVGGKDRQLQFHVPASELFMEVVVLSIYAAKMAQEGAIETAGEVVGAVAGV
ncbi:hypothetical protein BJY04DRAFT_189316 [Aspergillus karnatakaensis]|uniref:uncharacterized protein n=1 Tax=Aspergillus karnatakaensis TaxID=1810916 RepID=UPI003CCD70A6